MSINTSSKVIRDGEGEWVNSAPGIVKKVLHFDEETGETTLLLRFEPGSSYPLHVHPGTEEIFVLEGRLKVGGYNLRPGDYHYTPPQGQHAVSTESGCLVFLRQNEPDIILNMISASWA